MNALRHPIRRALAATLFAAVLGGAAAARAGTPATTADDICASNADPCNVTKVYDVTAGAVLDFGVRSVAVSGAGEFNFSNGSGRIQCGNFTASVTGTFLNASGPSPNGGTSSGSVLLLARRRCSIANPLVPCLDNNECELGPCGVRRCTLKSTRACTGDADCQLGACNALHRCTNNTSVRCLSDADCNFGTCPAQLTCTGRGDNPVNCSSNSDCSFGTCSVGTGSATLDGIVAGSSDRPATLVVRAADSVSISKTVNLNSSAIDSDGGSLSVDARAGSISITSKINATGGGQSTGGSVELAAGTDITIQDDINVVGGDFDGGSLDFTADRDVIIGRSLLANSGSGAGFGGDITIDAGRDFSFTGISASNKSTIEITGHTDIENSSGDGGSFDLTAGRNFSLGPNTRIIGNGSLPDGTGGEFSMEAGAGLSMSGDVVAKATGVDGSGGFVQAFADLGTATINPTATFDVTGGSGGGGYLEVESSGGDLDFDGDSDVSGGSGGSGGTTSLTARQAAHVSGTLLTSGIDGGYLSVDACRVTLESGGTLDNNASGINTLIAHDDMHLNAGSLMTTDASGQNTLRFRDSTKSPVVQGTVTPGPKFVLDPSLSDCPLCGNGTVDPGETCDDANITGGDGCSAVCQNEKCVAQTASPGYPAVALCEDGDLCTADVCNTSLNGGTCQHPARTCDDQVSCTADTCNPADGTCEHAPSDALCNDNNTCTDDFCSLSMGCAYTANSGTCDDNNRCTTDDVCASKVCKGTRINGCLFCGDDYLNPLGGEQCDDGNQVSGDCCSSTCRFEVANSVCEDGFFCTLDDRCDGAAHCVSGPPNSCADTNPCTADSCDEETISCLHAETPRDTSSCLAAPGAKFQIKNSANPKRDKLSWQWNNGNAFGAADVGAPAADTDYTLCVYDQSATGSSLAAAIDIAPSAEFWKAKDPVLQYKDKTGSSEGVTKAQIRSGEDGNTKVRVGAGGTNLSLPAPAGMTFFHQSPSVVVQLVNDMGKCWTSQFTPDNTKTNDAGAFKASTR